MNLQPSIRNFAIIAHIDHGKSTLADRLLEMTKTVESSKHEAQMLDRNPISRERGITIKLAPVRMNYSVRQMLSDSATQRFSASVSQPGSGSATRDSGGRDYILNLIDTPGHVDFSYEVDRTLASVEGAVLLVDATQGIQAQTIANTYKALEKNLVIIPVINKIDHPNAQIDQTRSQLIDFLGVKSEEIIAISAKTGEGVQQVLDAIIKLVPPPRADSHHETAVLPACTSLIFDSYYDSHKGVIAFVRVMTGSVTRRQKMRLVVGETIFETPEVGIFTPDLIPTSTLSAGEIGYIVTNLKDIHTVRVGDTIADASSKVGPLIGYKQVHPVVYASLFPTDPAEYENVKKSLEQMYLNDSALEFTPIYSQALGAGFRVGFLGLLHADVVRERLEREYNLNLVLTPPQVDYEREGESFAEPIVKILIITPQAYVGDVMTLCEGHRGVFKTMDNKNQVSIEYEMPLAEMISDFFDGLKSVTSGYASFDWELIRYQQVDADKLLILLNGDVVEEFSEIVVRERAQEKAYFLTKKLRELIPRQQYEVKVQAQYKGRIIASERISPFRKDVLMKGSKHVGAGDVGRKNKLLEKQKEGKKRMKMIGKVEIPKEAFIKLFNKK